MVVWIRDVVLMKLEKNPSPLTPRAGNVSVSGQRSGGSDCVKTCKEELQGRAGQCWMAEALLPTPMATASLLDKVLTDKTNKKPLKQRWFDISPGFQNSV